MKDNLIQAIILWVFLGVFIGIKYFFGFEPAVLYALAAIYNNQYQSKKIKSHEKEHQE